MRASALYFSMAEYVPLYVYSVHPATTSGTYTWAISTFRLLRLLLLRVFLCARFCLDRFSVFWCTARSGIAGSHSRYRSKLPQLHHLTCPPCPLQRPLSAFRITVILEGVKPYPTALWICIMTSGGKRLLRCLSFVSLSWKGLLTSFAHF